MKENYVRADKVTGLIDKRLLERIEKRCFVDNTICDLLDSETLDHYYRVDEHDDLTKKQNGVELLSYEYHQLYFNFLKENIKENEQE